MNNKLKYKHTQLIYTYKHT
uniref:Uncharacterized protein n=1 Tax=Anguilla anguilla TaxID=7936 RepID=A0A0E9S3N5_ANGAN